MFTSDKSPVYFWIVVSKSYNRFRGNRGRTTVPYLELEFAMTKLRAVIKRTLLDSIWHSLQPVRRRETALDAADRRD